MSVDFAVVGGTAAGNDYRLLGTGRLQFRGLSPHVRIDIVDDRTIEQDETIIVELSNPVNAMLGGRRRHTVTILASDAPAPDQVGNSAATARVDRRRQAPAADACTIFSSRPISTSTAWQLEAGDFVILDVDGDSVEGFNSVAASRMQILDSNGTTLLANVGASQEPDSFTRTSNPAHGFTAPHAGVFYVVIQSDAAQARAYMLNVHRVALATPQQDPAALEEQGAMFASLKGNALSITGPTGYGFTLVGNWVRIQTVETNARGRLVTTRYRLPDASTLNLRTPYGETSIGVVTSPVVINTFPSRFGDVVGEVRAASIALQVSLPLGDLVEDFGDRFGLEFEAFDLRDNWEIRLGRSIQSGTAFDVVMPAIPYLYFAGDADLHFTFGLLESIEITNDILVVFNPVDPSLGVRARSFYANLDPPSFHLSFRGMVPYKPDPEIPPTAPGSIAVTTFYGHAFATWEAPLTGIPVTWHGAATIDLDADDDGEWLGGGGNAHQLFRGNLMSSSGVLRDINLGFNGRAVYHHTTPGPDFDFVLGRASAAYNGDKQGIWFKGRKGLENPWAGSPLSDLEMNQEDVIEGTMFANGRFSLSTTSTMNLPGSSELHFTIFMSDREFLAEVEGTIAVVAGATINGVGAECRSTTTARGAIEIGYSSGLDWSGSLRLDGRLRCYAGGAQIASASFDVGGEIDNEGVVFDLPYVGDKRLIRWP